MRDCQGTRVPGLRHAAHFRLIAFCQPVSMSPSLQSIDFLLIFTAPLQMFSFGLSYEANMKQSELAFQMLYFFLPSL